MPKYYGYFTSPGSITGGTDILNGGAGDDQLSGGPDDDKFVFGVGSGNDVINDFNQGHFGVGSRATEHDLINVHAYGFSNWTALDTRSAMMSLGMPWSISQRLFYHPGRCPHRDLLQTDFII